jgi:diaminohydroxyphosphoribosylaminopyrimidine deaminase/5-amino-6-(5-phosphoribosylamino)uracil reductase
MESEAMVALATQNGLSEPPAPVSVADADHRYMASALRLSRRGLGQTWPNPSVGAVIVSPGGDDRAPLILGAGTTADAGRPHAERIALAGAGGAVPGATAYVTLEPCCHFGRTPPCTDALIEAGVARVVTAMADPDSRVSGQGHALLRDAGIAVESGVMERQARALHVGHITRIQTGRPFVTLKIAHSSDGYIAAAGHRPVAISSAAAMAQVHLLRSEYDAILVGIGTALADNPRLTVRLPGMMGRSPTRIVLDTHLRLPLDSQLAQQTRDASVWVVTASRDQGRINAFQNLGVDVIEVEPGRDGRLDLDAVLVELGHRGVTRLFVEGGATLSDAMLSAAIPDQVILARSSDIRIGSGGVAPMLMAGLRHDGLSKAYASCWESGWGSDTATVYRPAGSPFLDHRGIL